MKRYVPYILVLLIAVGVGCDRLTNGLNDSSELHDRLDLSDARSLIIVEPVDSEPGNLYKLTRSGNLLPVTFLADDGSLLEQVVYELQDGATRTFAPELKVEKLLKLTSNLIYLEGQFSLLINNSEGQPIESTPQGLLLRISDGALFVIEGKIDEQRSSRFRNNYFYTDNDGAIYYADGQTIYKLRETDSQGYERVQVSALNQQFTSFFVDGEGTLYYEPGFAGGVAAAVKIKPPRSNVFIYDLEELDVASDLEVKRLSNLDQMWVAEDREVYFTQTIDSLFLGGNSENSNFRTILSNFRIGEEGVSDLPTDFPKYPGSQFQWSVGKSAVRSAWNSETILVSGISSGKTDLLDVWGFDVVTGVYRSGSFPLSTEWFNTGKFQDSNKYLYYGAGTRIVRFSKETFTSKELLDGGNYTISDFSVAADGRLLFAGFANSEAEQVLVEIDSDGSLQELTEQLEVNIFQVLQLDF